MAQFESVPICPYCSLADRQVKAGMHGGVQRYKCSQCGHRYLLERKRSIAAAEVRKRAVELQSNGVGAREIADQLGVSVRTISNWLRKAESASAESQSTILADENPSDNQQLVGRDAKKRQTVVEVAELAGVSISTVSNFLTNKGRMSEHTRERVRQAIATLRFTPNSLVRAIRLRRTNIIGVVTFGIDTMDQAVGDNPTPTILSGIAAAAKEFGHNLLLYTLWFHRSRETSGLEFLDGHIDGLIWVSPDLNEPHLKTVAAAGLPTVALLAAKVPANAGFVAVDNITGMQRMVDHLVEQGHRRIAYIGSNEASDFVERIQGYRNGLAKNGIEFNPDLLATGPAISESWYFRDTSAYDTAINGWLHLRERPTAIMTSTDQWALWVARYLSAVGLKVPKDIALTGFDDTAAALKIEGGLTTVRQDFNQIARLGTDMLYKLIGGAPPSECRMVYPGEVIVRGSSGRPKQTS